MSGEYYNPYGSSPEPLYTRKPENGSSAQADSQKEPKSRRKLPTLNIPSFSTKLAGVIGVIVLVGVASYLSYKHFSTKSPLPVKIASQLKITAYYPTTLPQNYSVDTNSFTSAEGHAISFNILHAGGQTIGVSEEALPSGLDVNAPDPGGIQPEKFDTPIGPAQIRSAGANRIGYIVADKTFILFNLGNTPATDFHAIAKAFKKT